VKCLFCGQERAPTKEHVIPRWARDAFSIPGPVNLLVGGDGKTPGTSIHERPSLNITLDGQICSRCNNETLAGLERRVEPILNPMMRSHAATSLSSEQQGLLATWAVKTVYLLELVVRQKYPGVRPIEGFTPSEAELAWVWKEMIPPPRAKVWIACYDAQDRSAVMYEPSGAPLPAGGNDPVQGQFTTFALGYAAFQVFSVDFLVADEKRAAAWTPPRPTEAVEECLSQIWPSRLQTVSWPNRAFAHEDWHRLVTWDQGLRSPS
jgi:hypothetical protein